MTHRKPWKQPELIVLVRGKPEEAVLTACKGNAQVVSPSEAAAYCVQVGSCASCDASSPS